MGRFALLVLVGCGRIGFDAVEQPDDSSPAGNWSLVQHADNVGTKVIFSPSGAGNLIVIATDVHDAVVSVVDDAGSSYVMAPGSRSRKLNTTLEIWYASSNAGATITTVTAPVLVDSVVMWEFTGASSFPFLGATSLDDQAATTSPSGAPIMTPANALIVSAAITVNAITGTDPQNEFVNDAAANSDGFAHIGSNRSAAGVHQARWLQDVAGSYCSSTIAFGP